MTAKDGLSGVNDPVLKDLIWDQDQDGLKNLLTSLQNQNAIAKAWTADFQDLFGLGEYVGSGTEQSAVFRAVVGSLEASIQLGTRTTGTIVTTNDALTAVVTKDNQKLPWTDPKNAVNLASLLTSLRNQNTLAKNWDSFKDIFGIEKTYAGKKVTTAVFRALMGELEASIKLGTRTQGYVVTAKDDLSGVNDPVLKDLIWDQDQDGLKNLLTSLQNQNAIAKAWTADFQDLFGLGEYVGSGTEQSAVFRAVVGSLEASIQLGTRTTGTIVTTNDALTAVVTKDNQKLPWTDPKNAVNLASLLTSLRNQNTLAKNWDSFKDIFGIEKTYAGKKVTTAVFRALMGELEASIKLGTRTQGYVVTAKDDLSGVNDPVLKDLIWDQDQDGLKNLLTSLQNQNAIAKAWTADFQDLFGLGEYVGSGTEQSAVFRAVVGSLEASIQLGTRTTGTIVTTNDALTAVVTKDNQKLPWTDPKNAVNLASLLTSLRNQNTLAKNWDSFKDIFGIEKTYAGKKVTTAVFRALMGELEASIKLGTRTQGYVVTAKDDLSGVNDPVLKDLIWDQDQDGLKNLLTSLQNQNAIAKAWTADFQDLFGLGEYVGSGTEQSAVFRAVVGSLEASIQLGTRTTGTIVTTNDALTAVVTKDNQKLPWTDPKNAVNLASLLTSLRNQNTLAKNWDSFKDIFGIEKTYAGKKVTTAVFRALMGELESQVILGNRTTGIFVGLKDDLSDVTRNPGALVFTSINQVLASLQTQEAILSQIWNGSDTMGLSSGRILRSTTPKISAIGRFWRLWPIRWAQGIITVRNC